MNCYHQNCCCPLANHQSEESCSDDTNDTNVDDIEMQGSRTIGCDDGGQELQDNKSVDDNNCDSEQKDNSDDGCTNTFVAESCSGDYDMNDCDIEIQSVTLVVTYNINVTNLLKMIIVNEESCSDDSNDGNDDDIEIQDNTFVDRNDSDMEIQENKSVNDNDGDIEIQDNKSVNDNDGTLKFTSNLSTAMMVT
ncbi:protein PFC0760c-like [Ruditapes philippinarum]|uniref:protein PFC0760c-like n=1 Tax=Ruditapes philippinarum TaxID=129788 RepID=UPI00295BF952|nr:protein PFC0760c-like [Ruditapes philippinarum]